jgi:hypothetical protein
MKSQFCSLQPAGGLADEQVGEKRLEPQRALVFVAMDRFPHDAARDHRRARGTEMQFHFAAVGAFKRRGEIAGVGQAAAFAKRRADEAHLRPAICGRRSRRAPSRAVRRKAGRFRDKKSEADVEPVLKGVASASHWGMAKADAAWSSGRNLKKTACGQDKKREPAVNHFAVPQNQMAARLATRP